MTSMDPAEAMVLQVAGVGGASTITGRAIDASPLEAAASLHPSWTSGAWLGALSILRHARG